MTPDPSLDDVAAGLDRQEVSEDYLGGDQLTDMYLRAVVAPVFDRDMLRQAGYTDTEIDRGTQVFRWRGLIEPAGSDTWKVLPPEVSMPAFAVRLEQHARRLRASAANASCEQRLRAMAQAHCTKS